MESEFYWPPHWRRVIYKIMAYQHPLWMGKQYKVLARNPEYRRVMELDLTSIRHPLPPMHLDEPMEFDTVEELDNWARVAARID
jgi:hypothetical protein